jgi:hypothetical protein
MMDAMGVFFRYVFWAFPFRRLFAETADDNFSQFASGEGRFFELEGCRREAIWLRGRYQDLHLLTVSRERWREVGEPLHRRLMANAHRDQEPGAPDVGPSAGSSPASPGAAP